ncbi:Fic family protein [Hydrocarboniphaga sp.]|uniref:Fic family protein n=1 Tax=Hydrocarboniphaga sp. TaxID=2033016 RepID=UPI003D141CE1
MTTLAPLDNLDAVRFETPAVLKKLASASRHLAELKGLVASIPHQGILINTLGMQEAKDSSEIENIVTTHDELYQDAASPDSTTNPAAKEVLRYRQALWRGYEAVNSSGLLTSKHILEIQAELESNKAGFRKVPGTALKDGAGRVIYTPPSPQLLPDLMTGLEKFINDPALSDLDPLIRMALIHHQFETIHPFYDGNGRTGRIINVLYLVKEGLLDIPVLYLSRYIVRTKSDYYRLLQTVRENDTWEEWVIYMLTAVESTAREAIAMVTAIKQALLDVKHRIRDQHPKIYSQDLINNLFSHPYTKIEFIQEDLGVSRITATKYLEALTASGFLVKRKVGRSNYYINKALNAILTK